MDIKGGYGGTSDQFGYVLGYVLKGANLGLWKLKELEKGTDGWV